MRRFFWLSIWILLGTGQVLFVYLAGGPAPTSERPAPALAKAGEGLKAELLELARLTNEEWERLRKPAKKILFGKEKDPFLRREEALLEMEELERALRKRGVEVELVGLLRNWWEARESSLRKEGKGEEFNRYLSGLLALSEPFLDDVLPALPRRIYLAPEADSPFPALGLELEGHPEAMGRCLLERAGLKEKWILRELELLESKEAEAPWWLRGLYAYRGSR